MPRGRHFTNPDMRALDQEMDVLKERVAALEEKAVMPVPPVVSKLAEPLDPDPYYGVTEAMVGTGDEPALEATAEVAETLSPDKHAIKHAGFGRFQVLYTPTMEPIHEGWLTKDEAAAKLQELAGSALPL